MRAEPRWISLRAALAIHEAHMSRFGGAPGIRDLGLLESALARARNLFQYEKPGLAKLASAYAAGIVRNHPFVDGNKRTGFLVAAVFLLDNGKQLSAPQPEAVMAMQRLAAGEYSELEFSAWVEKHLVKRRIRTGNK